jgi:hypothetical protein
MRHVTNATRFRFLKTNPNRIDGPVIASEQLQRVGALSATGTTTMKL